MHFQKLYTDIFNEPVPGDGSVSMLKKVADEFPYFSLAHFFLLKQAINAGDNIDNFASKAALHFNNPFLLNEQLYRGTSLNNGVETSAAGEEVETKTESPGTPGEEEILPAPGAFENRVEVVEDEINVAPAPTPKKEEILLVNGSSESSVEVAPEEIQPVQAATPMEEDILPVPAAPVDHLQEMPVIVAEEKNESQISQTTPAENLPVNESSPGPVAKEKQKEEAPLFEPLFASDYFASQGIKLSEEQQPTDRMGKQLKSFTEWLKTMKKVHDPKVSPAEGAVDLAVQNLAEKSNKEEEVLTEAMADVFLQQGKLNKAKEIYEKLSLLNPSKSAYFAAKLEQIK